MVRYQGSIVVPFARERVWQLMSDWRNLAAWDVNISRSELAEGESPDNVNVGTRYSCTFDLKGRSTEVDYRVQSWDVLNSCSFVGLAGIIRSQDSLSFEDHPGADPATKISAEFQLNFRGPLALLSFVMNGKMQSTGPVVMKDMEEFVNKKLSASKEKE